MEFVFLKSLDSYLQSLIQSKLWVKIIVGVVLGIALGWLLGPTFGFISADAAITFGSWLALPGKIFMKLVQMIMIPLVFASIITGIVLTDIEQLKSMGLRLILYFVFTTLISVSIGAFLAMYLKPGKGMNLGLGEHATQATSQNNINIAKDLPETISNLLPSNPLASMVSGEMLAIVIFTIIIGVAITQVNEKSKKSITHLLQSIQEICMNIVQFAMRLIPYAVFGLMAQLTLTLGFDSIKSLSYYIFTVILGLFILLIVYLLIIQFFTEEKPLAFLKKIKQTQLLAFSTASSAAVMPMTIKTAEDELKVDKGISNFLVPIGATINMDGTSLYQCISTLFIMQAYGIEVGMANLLVITFTIVAASIGTPAIPGGGVIILGSVLTGVGVPAEGILLVIGIDRILGMFRTAINVTGDLTACLVFNKRR